MCTGVLGKDSSISKSSDNASKVFPHGGLYITPIVIGSTSVCIVMNMVSRLLVVRLAVLLITALYEDSIYSAVPVPFCLFSAISW